MTRDRWAALAIVLFIAWGIVGEYSGGRARAAAQALQDSIDVLTPQLDSAEVRTARAEGRVEVVERDYARDSVVWKARRDSLLAQAVTEEREHASIGDSIRARLDDETAEMFDRQVVLFDRILAGRDTIIELQVEELSGLRVRVAEWMVLADERMSGWDATKLILEQEVERSGVWEREAARLGNPSLVTKIRNGLPWLAAGYVGHLLSQM